MKLHVLSDLHVDFAEFSIPKLDDADVVILAGDISNSAFEAATFVKSEAKRLQKPIIYVLGNHEYMGEDFNVLPQRMGAVMKASAVHFLDHKIYTHEADNLVVLGATLWTDFALNGDPQLAMMSSHRMIDYAEIRNPKNATNRITTHDVLKRHVDDLTWIDETLRIFNGNGVVVTHHAPHRMSIHEQYAHEKELNAYFASDLTHLLGKKYAPRVWVHGHTHNSFDYIVGHTRVVCNPKGYGDENKEFNPYLMIEVSNG